MHLGLTWAQFTSILTHLPLRHKIELRQVSLNVGSLQELFGWVSWPSSCAAFHTDLVLPMTFSKSVQPSPPIDNSGRLLLYICLQRLQFSKTRSSNAPTSALQRSATAPVVSFEYHRLPIARLDRFSIMILILLGQPLRSMPETPLSPGCIRHPSNLLVSRRSSWPR